MKPLGSSNLDEGNGFCRTIPSRLNAVDSICQAARDLLVRCGQGKQIFAVELLFREFLNNAILHGHRSDHRKRVLASLRVGRKWIVLRIADEGPGFDWRTIRRIPPDETATSGRGLAIGSQYSARMQFNLAGNQVALWIRKND